MRSSKSSIANQPQMWLRFEAMVIRPGAADVQRTVLVAFELQRRTAPTGAEEGARSREGSRCDGEGHEVTTVGVTLRTPA
jgi:hypothetical protein